MTFDPLDWLDDELKALDQLFLRRVMRLRETAQGGHRIRLDGREVVNFGSNDYLGLAARLAQTVEMTPGWGSGSSPLIVGRGEQQAALEVELAEFESAEAALLFPSGYAANLGTVAALVDKGDIIFSDAANHASIIDGCRLSRARVQVFPHNDVDYLAMLLRQSSNFRRRLIVTEGLFSMDGDVPPLDQLCQLAEEHHAMMMVDEAHATGILGPHARGACEHFGVENDVPVRVGTLSKALGSIGGFVAGSRSLVDWLANRARSLVFSTAMPDTAAAAGRAGLQAVRQHPQAGRELLHRAADLRSRLHIAGWDTSASQSQIISLIVGDSHRTMQLTDQLLEQGVFIPGIRPPTVPHGESRLRLSLTTAHDDDDIAQVIQALGHSHHGHA